MRALRKSSLREIRKSLGRYLAILAIVALGVGFFSGLRVCRDSMVETGDDYLDRQSMYDYRLVSTVVFDTEDAEAFAGISGVTAAAGAVSQDALVDVTGLDMSGVVIFNSLTEDVNEISLTAGRLPRAASEAVADAQLDVYKRQLQHALTHLRLIGRVGGDERLLGSHRADHGGYVVVVRARAAEDGAVDAVLRRHAAHLAGKRQFRKPRREVELFDAQPLRHGGK